MYQRGRCLWCTWTWSVEYVTSADARTSWLWVSCSAVPCQQFYWRICRTLQSLGRRNCALTDFLCHRLPATNSNSDNGRCIGYVSSINLLLLQTNGQRISTKSRIAEGIPQKTAPSLGGSGSPHNTRFLGLDWVHIANGTSISSAIFVGLRVVRDRQTDKPCYICSNRPHLCTPCMQSGLMIWIISAN